MNSTLHDDDPDDVMFEGSSAQECEDFIRTVRRRAFQEDRHRDREWMAGFASTCFAGQALQWHSNLDVEIQMDWRLLEQALIAQYMVSHEDQIGPSNPSRPSSPITPIIRPPLPGPRHSQPPAYDTLSIPPPPAPPRTIIGRIRVVSNVARGGGYLSKAVDSWKCHVITHSASDALRVEFATGSSEPRPLKVLTPSSEEEWLGARWYDRKLELPSSDHFAYLFRLTGPSTMEPSSTVCKGPTRAAIWEVSSNGTLNASWIDEERETTHALEVAVNNTSKRVAIVGDYNVFVGYNRAGYSKVRLVIEPQ